MQPLCSKVITEVTTEMPRSRSMPIQSDRVRRRSPFARTEPGELDRAAGAQQALGQRGLAGVGVRDDREGAAAGDFFFRSHGWGLSNAETPGGLLRPAFRRWGCGSLSASRTR